jgi:hypothetical protein
MCILFLRFRDIDCPQKCKEWNCSEIARIPCHYLHDPWYFSKITQCFMFRFIRISSYVCTYFVHDCTSRSCIDYRYFQKSWLLHSRDQIKIRTNHVQPKRHDVIQTQPRRKFLSFALFHLLVVRLIPVFVREQVSRISRLICHFQFSRKNFWPSFSFR